MVEVKRADGSTFNLYVACLGVKGDWPWQSAKLSFLQGIGIVWCVCWNLLKERRMDYGQALAQPECVTTVTARLGLCAGL